MLGWRGRRAPTQRPVAAGFEENEEPSRQPSPASSLIIRKNESLRKFNPMHCIQ
jgi:hypothetical protein